MYDGGAAGAQERQEDGMRPIIGITPLVDTDRDSYWMLPGYMKGLERAGGLPMMLPLTNDSDTIERAVQCCDGFLFAGGHDIAPGLYEETPTPRCGVCVPERDRMETALLQRVLAVDKPLFGICRGLQLLSAALGGTLYQDLPTQLASNLEHHQRPPYEVPAHAVNLETSAPLYALLGKSRLRVNSYHHQGVRTLPPALSVMASADDGLIEAVFAPGYRFVWAVQWHPEFACEQEDSRAVFRAFVQACGQQSDRKNKK